MIWACLHADIPALNRGPLLDLGPLARRGWSLPLRRAFTAAQGRSEIRACHPDLLAGSFLWLMDGLSYGQTRLGAPPRSVMADDLISILLDGLRPRPELR